MSVVMVKKVEQEPSSMGNPSVNDSVHKMSPSPLVLVEDEKVEPLPLPTAMQSVEPSAGFTQTTAQTEIDMDAYVHPQQLMYNVMYHGHGHMYPEMMYSPQHWHRGGAGLASQ